VTATAEVASYLDALLETTAVPDFDNALNGLQLENNGTVTKIAACVDFSSRAVSGAIEARADLLLLRHGMFWPGLKPITGVVYARLQALIANNVAVYSSHLPLDRHPIYGNNVLLSKQLGLDPSGEFAWYKGKTIGVTGESDIATADLVEHARQFARRHGGNVITTEYSAERRTRRWATCTGAGASTETLEEIAALGVDTLVVGEGPHHTAVEARETGLVIIYAGHYATETVGVAALAEHIGQKFDMAWTVIDAPTGL
jgi:dinuclear metal center YbgI/SA1388 family protein